jgi:hypothetical protein
MDMKKFLAVFIGTEASSAKWETLDEESRREREQAGKSAWHAWVEKNKSHLVEGGSPLGVTKKVGPSGISDFSNELCAFTIIQAESHEAAARLFLEHPHFTIFPGDSVEIMECLPIPGI